MEGKLWGDILAVGVVADGGVESVGDCGGSVEGVGVDVLLLEFGEWEDSVNVDGGWRSVDEVSGSGKWVS